MDYKTISRILVLLSLYGITIPIYSQNSFYIDCNNMGWDQREKIGFGLQNSNNFTGFQLDVKLPRGLWLDNPDNNLIIETSERLDGFNINYNYLKDDVVRFIAFSSSHKFISGEDGNLFSCYMMSNSEFEGGDIVVSDIIFSDETDHDIVFQEVNKTINLLPSDIWISPDYVEIKIGESLNINYELYPEKAVSIIYWSSEDSNIATVDNAGKVKGISQGSTVISIKTDNGLEAECYVNVYPVEAESVILDRSDYTGHEGTAFQLSATVEPANTTNPEISWSSSNEDVASVDQTGLVSLLNIGTATITARCGEVSAECSITVLSSVIEAEEIILNIESAELNIGESIQLEALVLPENTTHKIVYWETSNIEVASVSENGLVTALSEGSVVINATCGDISAFCQITVLDDAGVDSIIGNLETKFSVYTMDGILIKKDCDKETLKWLSKGFYIILSGKHKYKISI